MFIMVIISIIFACWRLSINLLKIDISATFRYENNLDISFRKNRLAWHNERWLDIDCLTVNQ